MKGRKLTLQEVLNLEDGTKVWVEDSRRGYTNELCIYKKEDNILLVISDNTNYILDVIEVYENKLEFYEWVEEELKIPDQIEEPYYSQSVVESMANEIARHRYPNKYEYDDELIEKIISEFS